MRRGRSKQFDGHFDLAEGCSALELIPLFLGRLKLLIAEMIILLLEQELCSLVLCSLPSILLQKNPCMWSLGFDRNPSKNLEKSLSCSQPCL